MSDGQGGRLGLSGFEEGALKGLHKDFKHTIENDKELVWHEIYSFLLADIAMSLRKITNTNGE